MESMVNPFDNADITTYDRDTFGRCVRERRHQLGKPIQEMSEEIGISSVYLDDIERAFRLAPETKYLNAMMAALELTEAQKENFLKMAAKTYEGPYVFVKLPISNL